MSYRVLNSGKKRPEPMHTNLAEQGALDSFYRGELARLPASVLSVLFDASGMRAIFRKRGRQRGGVLPNHPEWMAARRCRLPVLGRAQP